MNDALVGRRFRRTRSVVCPHDDGDDCKCRKPRSRECSLKQLGGAARLPVREFHGRRPLARCRGGQERRLPGPSSLIEATLNAAQE